MTTMVMLMDRACCNPTMTECAIFRGLCNQRPVQQECWDRFVSYVHLEVWSIDDRDDGLLSRVESRTNALIDVFPKSKKIKKGMCTICANKFALPSIPQRPIDIL